jgi:transglutaminase-like putative cysteine protease
MPANNSCASPRRTPLLRTLPLACLLLLLANATAADAQTTQRERRFTFEYTATVRDVPAGAGRIDLWLPVPTSNKYQEIANLRVTSPHRYEMRDAQYGNKLLHLRVERPTAPSFNVTVSFEAVRREHVNTHLRVGAGGAGGGRVEPPGPDLARWLQPDRLVPLDDKIRTWAREVVEAANARTDLEKARAIYNHVVSTVKYDKTGTGWGRGDIYYACDARRGNCTDFHAIFIGYARAVGLPARFSIGFPLPAERGAGQISGYHCWAETYVRGTGWVPVDASEAAKDPSRREYFFGAHDENRVEFTRGRDLTLEPRQAGDPLNYFIYPYAEVDGKPHAGVDRKFQYRDLGDEPRATAGGR